MKDDRSAQRLAAERDTLAEHVRLGEDLVAHRPAGMSDEQFVAAQREHALRVQALAELEKSEGAA